MKKMIPKHPLAIRWMHWINFPVLFVMIWSGLLIYWANDVYKIHLGRTVYFSFFPESFYKGLNLSRRLAEGMAPRPTDARECVRCATQEKPGSGAPTLFWEAQPRFTRRPLPAREIWQLQRGRNPVPEALL